MQKHGFVIALDGPDGVGKTTQLDLLTEYFQKKGRKVHTTRASGGTAIGEELRNVSLSRHSRPTQTDVFISLAMFAALADDLQTQKSQHDVILIDRSPLAMVAYNAYGGQLPEESHNILTPPKPRVLLAAADTFRAWEIDILLFLDASQDALNNRRKIRQTEDYFENQDEHYHHRVREGYQAGLVYLDSLDDVSAHILKEDASPDISTIHQSIVSKIEARLVNP
jgi:dTMP kinase